MTYIPQNWFWIIGGDTSRAWSTAAGAYVETWDESRVFNVADEEALSNILRNHGLKPIIPNAVDVRAEAQRRIVALVGATDLTTCLIKQLNANMRASELNDIQHSRELTPEETAEANALRGLATIIKAIRAASNVLEPNPPADYAGNQHWPA